MQFGMPKKRSKNFMPIKRNAVGEKMPLPWKSNIEK
jgi:hypothetical protein